MVKSLLNVVGLQFFLTYNFALDSILEVELTKCSYRDLLVGKLAVKEKNPFGEGFAGPDVKCVWVSQEVDVLLLEQS